MNNKKEKSTALVLFTIFLLLLFIVLPPVFRVLFPKVEVETNTVKTITILNCNIDTSSDNYHINIKSKYIDNKIKSSEVVISPLDDGNGSDSTGLNDNQNIEIDTDVTNYVTAAEIMTFFNSLNGINVENYNNDMKFLIDSELIENNLEQVELKKYFTDLRAEKEYFISQGYKCNEISN